MPSKRGDVRVMTWNIHGGGATRRDRDLGLIIKLIQRHDPDIVALQEIDARGLSGCAFECLREALGEHAAEARLITAPDGDFGHAIISRFPMLATLRHDISVGRREPRAAIETTVDTGHGLLQVIAVHLGLSFQERRLQSRLLAEMTQNGSLPSIVLGDFNDWVWRGSVQRALSGGMFSRGHHRTFPAWFPVLELDRIYARPGPLLIRSWTDPAARLSSDHLPVIADLRLAMTETRSSVGGGTSCKNVRGEGVAAIPRASQNGQRHATLSR
jgi:endonuclease/exonuclease/phosphatase family metal-dependent hydrolase